MADTENTQEIETSTNETSEQDKKLANLVNSAVSSHLKRSMGKMNETIESILSEKLTAFQSQSTAQVPSQAKEKSAKEESEVAKLRAELAAEKRQTLEKDTYSSIKEKLNGKVRPEAIGSVLKILKADSHIDFKKDGPVFKFDGEELDLDSGLEAWLENSEDAKLFKPAPQSQLKKSPFKAQPRTPSTNKMDPRSATEAELKKLGLLGAL